MSFQTFIEKPVSSKVVLLEFGSSVDQSFFINFEPGIWRYQYHVLVDRTYSFENGAFCYGCFEQGCSGPAGNDQPDIQIISVNVDGTLYTKVSNLATLRITNQSFYWDGTVVYIHFDNFDPPWVFSSITLGAQINIASKSGNYNGLFYDGRLKSMTPISAKADPLFFGLIRFSGASFVVANEDGQFDSLTTLDLFGQAVEIRYGEEGAAYADFEKRFVGQIEDFSISYEELSVNVKELRKGWSRSVPASFYDLTTYPDIKPQNAEKPIPVGYGTITGAEVICTNEEESPTPANYDFKIVETTYHAIFAIDEVRVNGVVKIPSSSSLANATFSLAAADYSPGDEVRVDFRGYVDSGGSLMDNALDILADVVKNYADFAFTGDTYDIIEWGAARAAAPTIHFYSASAIQVNNIIQKICTSLDGIFYIKTNGKATFRYYHDLNPIVATAAVRDFLNSPVVNYPSENYLSTAVVNYNEDFELGFLTVKDESKELELTTLFSISNREEFETLLVNNSDANALLGFLVQEYALIAAIVDLRLPIEFVDVELLDYVRVTLDRLNASWLGEIDFQVIGVSQDLIGSTVRLTLRDKNVTAPIEVYIQGNHYGDSVGGAFYGDVNYERTQTVEAGGG